MAQDGYGSKAVLLIQLLPPQIRVRSTPDSRHDGDGPAHLRFVPQADQGFLWKGDYVFYKPGIGRPSKALLPPIASARAKTPPVAISTLEVTSQHCRPQRFVGERFNAHSRGGGRQLAMAAWGQGRECHGSLKPVSSTSES